MSPKSQENKIDGIVIESLPSTTFRVKLDDNREVFAYLSGKMRMNFIRILEGDRVSVEIGPSETKGRIVYRYK